MKEHYSLLTDQEIELEADLIRQEMPAGHKMDMADIAARFGISVETALQLASAEASIIHGRPMRFIRASEVN